MDAALDDLIDTLGGPEETEEDNTTYTGPEVLVCDLDVCKDGYLANRSQSWHMKEYVVFCHLQWNVIMSVSVVATAN